MTSKIERLPDQMKAWRHIQKAFHIAVLTGVEECIGQVRELDG